METKKYIISKIKLYLERDEPFAHIKDLCLKENWGYKYFSTSVFPKYIEAEKSLALNKREISNLLEAIKNKHELYLLSICSSSVSGAMFLLKTNYNYSEKASEQNYDEAIKILKATHEMIKASIF